MPRNNNNKMNFTLYLVFLCASMSSLCIANIDKNGYVSESNTWYINRLTQVVADLEQKMLEQEAINTRQWKTIERLEQKLTTTTQELDNFKERSDTMKRGNFDLSSGRYARQAQLVAFTAYIGHIESHLGIDHTLIYDKVLLNEGSAYNSHTGVFTCPFDGVYSFNFVVATNGTEQIVAKLVVDGANQVDGIADTYHTLQEAQGGNSAILSLHQGQSVWVSNYRWADKEVFSNGKYRYSTFSGHLMFYR